MKHLLLVTMILGSMNSFAARTFDQECFFSSEKKNITAYHLCKGVKNLNEKKAVEKCYADSIEVTTGDRAAVLCSGVKSDKEAAVVIACYKGTGTIPPDHSVVICSGVKSKAEADKAIDCFLMADIDKNGAAFLCSKVGLGGHLFYSHYYDAPENK